jgi:hypothetical protein
MATATVAKIGSDAVTVWRKQTEESDSSGKALITPFKPFQ